MTITGITASEVANSSKQSKAVYIAMYLIFYLTVKREYKGRFRNEEPLHACQIIHIIIRC